MSTSTIGATLASPSFGTLTAKTTWTRTASTFTTNDIEYVTSVAVSLWGSAPDKKSEDPYKTMNSWYNTNKAAIKDAAKEAAYQVASWALVMDWSTNVKSTTLWAPAIYTDDGASPPTRAMALQSSTDCSDGTTVAIDASTANAVSPAVGDYGDVFSVGIVNSTVGTKSPLLRWGSRVTVAPDSAGTTAAAKQGTAAVSFDSYAWTQPTSAQIASYSAIASTEYVTLVGDASLSTTTLFATSGSTLGLGITTTGSAITCGTEWATTTDACAGVTKWGVGTLAEATNGGADGSVQAWMWLADLNPTTPSAVFGVEKEDIMQIVVHQQTAWVRDQDATNAPVLPDANDHNDAFNTHRNNWGVATFTGTSGASATLLGASAVMAALVSFF